MKDKYFIDTNVLVYLYSIDEIKKKERVEVLLQNIELPVISTQVINEFINVLRKKKAIDLLKISDAIQELSAYFDIAIVTISTIELALAIAHQYQYSYFDSLIIASALENNCSILYTEDMHTNQIIKGTLSIVNPFV